jgi:hypothetical protein
MLDECHHPTYFLRNTLKALHGGFGHSDGKSVGVHDLQCTLLRPSDGKCAPSGLKNHRQRMTQEEIRYSYS